MKIGIIGFGVLGHQIKNFLLEANSHMTDLVVFDDFTAERADFTILPFNSHSNDDFGKFNFYIGLGYRHLDKRSELISVLKTAGRKVKTLIHKTCYISPTAKIGDGCILFPGVSIGQNVVVNDGCILHNGVIISHDSVVGASCYLAPGTILSGDVITGKHCFLGSGTVISNSIVIGDNVRVGIGSVVTKNIEANLSVIGNPAVILTNKLNIK